jgi:hypothetical protein
MSRGRLAIASACAAMTLCACGSSAKPQAGASSLRSSKPPGRGVIDDPRRRHLTCLEGLHLAVLKLGTTDLLLGAAPAQARIRFEPTPGAAQEAQISGQVQGAEVIGSALLFPHAMSDQELKPVENCLAQGVNG